MAFAVAQRRSAPMTVRQRRLRRELLLRLLLPLLAIIALTGAIGFYAAQRLSDRVFDRWLLDAARSLAHQVRFSGAHAALDLSQTAESILIYDDTDQVSYSVSQQQRHLFGHNGIPAHGTREARYPGGRAFDARYAGKAVRVAAVEVDGGGTQALVLVAETTSKRQRTQQEVLLMLLPMALLLLVAAAAISGAVQATLRPLEAIAARWKASSHVSLRPIGADDVPRELVPFAAALNELLARIRAQLARERSFVATVAHQLRTPLAGMRLGLARAAQAGDLAATRQVLAELDQASERTARLLQQLLALGRLDPEMRADLDVVDTDLAALAHDVGAAYVDQALEQGIDFELLPPPAPVHAAVQPDLLAEAIGNLLDNALRYTPRGGRVVIDFEAAPPALRISDSGPGVAADEREAVFERLVRGRNARGDGSGLGLAIVRDIAALHGATATLAASALGGASVVLRFPAAA